MILDHIITKESLAMDNKIKKKEYLTLLLCALCAFFFMTLNSRNSFLYKFNVNADQQCFVTTARCMLRGDVLFRDVHEHRGTINSLIYCVGLLITRRSFIGIYIIETLFFTAFLFFSAKIARALTDNRFIWWLTVLLTGFFATSFLPFCGGGESEEFVLPFLVIPIYITVQHFSSGSDKKFRFLEMASAGACFAVVFWIKYTLTGLFIGFVAAVIVYGIKHKHIKDIFVYAGQFLVGALIGSLPVIIYHAVTNSFYDMCYVYFYSLIFKYSDSCSAGSASLTMKLLAMLWYILPFGAAIMLAPKKKLNKLFLILMLAGEAAGIMSGFMWGYACEPMFAFVPLCIPAIWLMVDSKLVSNTKLNGRLKKAVDSLKSDYEKAPRKNMRAFILIASVAVGISTFPVSCTFGYRKYKLSDYPQYKIGQYIREHSKTDDPIVVNYDCLEQGIYWCADIYPPDKYYCSYNLDSEEINAVYDEYINGKKADYIVTISCFNVPNRDIFDGYKTVMFEALPDNWLDGGSVRYQLMERTDT